MVKELLMLQHLGIDGALINYIVKNFSNEDLGALLNGGAFDMQFKHNVFTDEHLNLFYEEDKIKKTEENVNTIIQKSLYEKIKIISFYDDEYPQSLKAIKNSPLFVHIKGNLENLNARQSIACVGTRSPSLHSIHMVHKIVKGLAETNTIIVSGLAKGIDSEAHTACLDSRGTTIAVLAHGLDTLYPKENSKLAESILENGGTLLSEYPVGTKGVKSNFVARNRLISGLSDGVIVFEADEKSGTMHTARFAYTQNKKIFCPFNSAVEASISTGVKKLLTTQSAIPITDASDVLSQAFSDKKQVWKISIGENLFNELELISTNKGVSVDELANTIIQDYIEGAKRT